ncbi:MAG TPA: D-serine ammonia-lyase [Soehngenia sp.]|nr:D-serine ammonia-lyase [Soehngenia sp.]HPP30981.1 D-serine ammonia-lyase [Soehngenia sp.]
MDLINNLREMKEVLWLNPHYEPFDKIYPHLEIKKEDVIDAKERFKRFEPFIKKAFELESGTIESKIDEINNYKTWYESEIGEKIDGKILLKRDDLLPIAGSIKGRGGVYEVLKIAETLAVNEGILSLDDDYALMMRPEFKDFFKKFTIQVGSTGNLGLSIGMISSRLGFNVIVHMSIDAKQWKKDMLRANGVKVIEYEDDYSKAVEMGRMESEKDPNSFFIDDENSKDLFLGYAVGGLNVKSQLEKKKIFIDETHPLVVFLPCGVGGGPGGVLYGLKLAYKDLVHCYFAEPTHSPSMLLGLATKKHNEISVLDIGLDNKTQADGLAVGRPSGFVGKFIEKMINGCFTVSDEKLFYYLRGLYNSENIFIEPSSLAGFNGISFTKDLYSGKSPYYMMWSTGGSLVPESERKKFMQMFA